MVLIGCADRTILWLFHGWMCLLAVIRRAILGASALTKWIVIGSVRSTSFTGSFMLTMARVTVFVSVKRSANRSSIVADIFAYVKRSGMGTGIVRQRSYVEAENLGFVPFLNTDVVIQQRWVIELDRFLYLLLQLTCAFKAIYPIDKVTASGALLFPMSKSCANYAAL